MILKSHFWTEPPFRANLLFGEPPSRRLLYKERTLLHRIGMDYKCAHFHAVAQWGKDRYQYNEAYSLNNHITMAKDRPRVEAFRRALDLGSPIGPPWNMARQEEG